MKFTRIRDLVAVAIIAGVLAWVGLRSLYSVLPTLPKLAAITFGVLAVVEAIFAWQLRARIAEGKVQPLTAARAVALAKASSLVGALMFGVWGGVAAYLLPQAATVTAAANDSVTAVIGLIGSAMLVGAALWLEQCCRTPDPPHDRDKPGPL
ncbi:DUF3180 domain-containing protein [Kutzneria viridogrisea]|uniref:DUF3180 domain-containing protein n=2 Tax=Kutzneria TaxID=43356 RepID=A0ABR6BWJ7_9PSEU|nr:DUF3180 domain-containing protein [Kutzneria albida]AHH93743.1 putative secreted protein [Kutzneria albida DSM 43870]MBA8931253.1 hypothetical protein [Kutzneria viridogrisea]